MFHVVSVFPPNTHGARLDSGKKNFSSCSLPEILSFFLQDSLYFRKQMHIFEARFCIQVCCTKLTAFTWPFSVPAPQALCMHPLAGLQHPQLCSNQQGFIMTANFSDLLDNETNQNTAQKSLFPFPVNLFPYSATPVLLDWLDTKLVSPLRHIQ